MKLADARSQYGLADTREAGSGGQRGIKCDEEKREGLASWRGENVPRAQKESLGVAAPILPVSIYGHDQHAVSQREHAREIRPSRAGDTPNSPTEQVPRASDCPGAFVGW